MSQKLGSWNTHFEVVPCLERHLNKNSHSACHLGECCMWVYSTA